MSVRFVSNSCLADWLKRMLTVGAVYIPEVIADSVHWRRLDETGVAGAAATLPAALRRIRAAEPAKSFLFAPREVVARLPEPLPDAATARQIVFGLKNCDVHAMRVHRRVLLEGQFADPFYATRAAATLLVASDCPEPADTCFCNLAGLSPYVGERADLSVSVVDDGLLVETLTEAGEELLQPAELFHSATEAQLAERERSRAAAVAKLGAANPEPWKETLPAAIAARMADEQFWRRQAATCVECFGCLMACPTCYCFLLCDQAEAGMVRRSRVWDACYQAAYTRVGGGANPRGEFLKRFANRFECKYKEFHNDHGFFACSGCGRCVGVCMGRIDVRQVLKEA